MQTFTVILYATLLTCCSAQILGQVEFASPQLIRGWACDVILPARTVTVQALEVGTVLASSQANLFRPDIANQCRGTASHGFEIRFPPNIATFLGTGTHSVAVRGLLSFGGGILLSGSPVTILQNITATAPQNISVQGILETVNSTHAVGWACDPNLPQVRISVNILVDGNFIGSLTANQFREPTVSLLCGNDPNHGFVFAFPADIAGILGNRQPHTVEAIGLGTTGGQQLTGSPQTVGLVRIPSARGVLETANLTTVTGWACDRQFPLERLTVNILLDGILIGTAVANVRREANIQTQCGNAFHGFVFAIPPNILDTFGGESHMISAFAVPAGAPGGTPVSLAASPITIVITP